MAKIPMVLTSEDVIKPPLINNRVENAEKISSFLLETIINEIINNI